MRFVTVLSAIYFLTGYPKIAMGLLQGLSRVQAVAALYGLVSFMGLTGCFLEHLKNRRLAVYFLVTAFLLSAPLVSLRNVGFSAPSLFSIRVFCYSMSSGSTIPRPVLGVDFLPLIFVLLLAWCCSPPFSSRTKASLLQFASILLIACLLGAIIFGLGLGREGVIAGVVVGFLVGAVVGGSYIYILRKRGRVGPTDPVSVAADVSAPSSPYVGSDSL